MRILNINASCILGLAQNRKLKVGEVVFSTVNNTAYKVLEGKDYQGVRIYLEEQRLMKGVPDIISICEN